MMSIQCLVPCPHLRLSFPLFLSLPLLQTWPRPHPWTFGRDSLDESGFGLFLPLFFGSGTDLLEWQQDFHSN